jgi:capsular polysaccharide biosynthesis protein/MinD-like ATPase involved in chromosome partitioning or flagellar assembly
MPNPELTLSSYLSILRARRGLIVVVASVCVLVAAYAVLSAPRNYSASADLLISPISSADDDFVGVQVLRDSGVAPSSDVLTVARLIKTPATAAIVAKQPGLQEPEAALLGKITVSPLSQTSMVAITATGSSPGQAAAIANGFASATISRRTGAFQTALRPIVGKLQGEADTLGKSPAASAALPAIEGRLAVLQPLLGAPDPTLELLNRAEPPASASSRHTALAILAALAGGLLLGIVVALLRELIDRRIRGEQELKGILGAAVLGRIPGDAERSTYAAATAFRDLRARLFDGDEFPATVVFTETRDGNGATAAAVQLAHSLARAGTRVVLLDCDFERAAIADEFGVAAPPSGFDALFGSGDPNNALVAAPGNSDRLRLALPTLSNGRNRRLAQLDPAAIRRALVRLHTLADVVVVDTTPLGRGSDALLVADAAGATVVSVRLGSTSKHDLEELGRMLDERGVSTTGVVVFAAVAPRRLVRSGYDRARAALRFGRQPTASGGRPTRDGDARAGRKRRRVESSAARSQ